MTTIQQADLEEHLERALDCILRAERALADALDGADFAGASELAERVEQLARLLYRLQIRAAGAVESESPAVRGGSTAPGAEPAPFRRGCDLLRTRLRISGTEARRRIRAAARLLPRASLTGEALEPHAPTLAQALGDDESTSEAPGPEAIEVVLRVVAEAEQVADPEVARSVEDTLTGYTATFDPETLRRLGRHILAHLDPDGAEPSEREATSRQGVRVGATWRGLTHLDIWADSVQTEVLLTVFDTGTNPRVSPCTGAGTGAGTGLDSGTAVASGIPTGVGTGVGTDQGGTASSGHQVQGEPDDSLDPQMSSDSPASAGSPNSATSPGSPGSAHSGSSASSAGSADSTRSASSVSSAGSADSTRSASSASSAGSADSTRSASSVSSTGSADSTRSASSVSSTGLPGSADSARSAASSIAASSPDSPDLAMPGPGGSPPPRSTESCSNGVTPDASDGLSDPRTRPQRMLDALVAACQAALRVGALPDIGGLPPQLHVTIELAELRAESPTAQPSSREQRSGGAGYLVHAGQVPTKLLRRLACDADVIPIVLGGRGEVLDMGRRSRLATPAVRRALISRDGGCLFPGCTVPATWTEAHHVVPWYVDGTTDVNQMVLLCPYHHHAVHTGRWVVEPEGPDHRPGPGQRPRPFRLTTPWSALPDLTRNLYHLGA